MKNIQNNNKRGQKRKNNTPVSGQNAALALNVQKHKKQKPITHKSLRAQTRLDKHIDTFTDLITSGLSQNNNNLDTQKLLSTYTEIKDTDKSKSKELIESSKFNQFFNQLVKGRKQHILEKLIPLWCNNPVKVRAFNEAFTLT